MLILAVVRACVFWALMSVPAPAPAEMQPIRLYSSPATHVGLRFHSDAIGDAAITVQLTATWLSL